jgi:uncharacterized protein YecE (DUF72 family)
MDFGRLPNIDNADFTFPPEHPGNVNILPGFPSEEIATYVGCPIWGEKGWVGKIYPKGTKEKDYLKFYAEKFSSIELNATHYQIPNEDTIIRWRDSVPDHFRFCPKIPQSISHTKDLVKTSDQMMEFVAAVRPLGQKLGTSFLQLPPYFGPDKIKQLIYFLNGIPDDFPLAVEFRHEGWFKDRLKFDKIFNYLEDRLMCAVITDVAGRRDVLHQRLSNRTAFIRFTANDLHATDFTRINDWAILLKKWLAEGLKEIYFFVHTPDHALCPELANHFLHKMKIPQVPLPPTDQYKQGSLFD